MNFGLSKKIILVIELVVIVVAISCSVVALYIQRDTLQNLTYIQLQSISTLKEYSLKRYINHAIDEMEFLTTNKQMSVDLYDFLQNKNQKQKQVISSILDETKAKESAFLGIFLLDKVGDIVVSSDPKEEGKIRNEEAFFQKAKEGATAYDFFYDPASEKPDLIISTPIINKQGIFLGVLAGKINLKDISDLMSEKSGLGQTGESYLVDSFNLVITDLAKEPGAALKKTLLNLPQIDRCLNGNTNFDLLPDYHGDQVFGYWHWIPEMKSCLVTKIDSAEALAPMQKIALSIFEIMAVIIFLVGIVGYLLGQSIINPLRRLRNLAIKIKGGDLKAKADIKTKDEIGEIALVFNEMVSHLSEYTENLEAKVRERTTELYQKVSDLEQTEKAVTNLLEDIEEEKKNIEHKVEERTHELREEQARLLASINSLSFGFIIADTEHKIILKNNAAMELFGLKEEEISIDEISKLFEKHINLKAEIEQCTKGKEVCEIKEITFGSKSLRSIVAPIVMRHHEKTIGYVLLFEDVTEAKVIERSREEFFAVASHELRTPLTAIRGNMSTLRDFGKALTENDKKEMINDTYDASVRLIGIVNEFLDTSRLEQGKTMFKKEKVDLPSIIRETCKEFEPLVKEKLLSLNFIETSEPLPLAFVDKDRIKQVVSNFIDNAMKYTTKGTITVSIERVNSFLAVYVSDTGKGISPQNQVFLFRKFQQAGEEILTRDVSESTGLGLYIAKLMVEAMGGTASLVKSIPGEGSTFRFTVPIVL